MEGRQAALLLPDSKIVDEAFLEDVSAVLNCGEVWQSGPGRESAQQGQQRRR